MKVFVAVTLVACVQIALASPAVDYKGASDNMIQGPADYNTFEESLLRKINTKCAQNDVSSCIMLKLITYMNRLMKKQSIEVNSNLEITQSTTTVQLDQENARSLPSDITKQSEEMQVTQLIADKVWNFVKSRSLKYKLFDDAEIVVSSNPAKEGTIDFGLSLDAKSALGDARGKKNNYAGAIVSGAIMKFGVLGFLAFKGLVLLVGKALILSKVALLLAVVIGLKKLFSQQKHVTYEVVSHPHHSHSHVESGHEGWNSGGWGRSFEGAQDLAYSNQKPQA